MNIWGTKRKRVLEFTSLRCI